MYANHLKLIVPKPTISSGNHIKLTQLNSEMVDVHLDKTRSFESSFFFFKSLTFSTPINSNVRYVQCA